MSVMLYGSLEMNMFSVKVCNMISFAAATESGKDLEDMKSKDGETSDSQSSGRIS